MVSGASGLYGGPVALPGQGEACDLVAQAFLRHGGLRTVRRELVWAPVDPPQGSWPGLRRLQTSVLGLPADVDFDHWYEQSLRPARRKERRRLHRHGYRTHAAEGAQFLAAFHEIYTERSLGWGSEPLPRESLESLLDSGPAWRGFVAHDADDALVGAHICIDLGNELFAWLGTARRVEPGSIATLLIEEELRWCHEHGRCRLNLGTSAGLAGVSDFKQGISATDDPRWILRWQRGRGHC
ncbi:hypothetical protein DRQ32_11655 [bacterium]|nr:MAG: hypothetical protein DRQ32_11655 [bacterium]